MEEVEYLELDSKSSNPLLINPSKSNDHIDKIWLEYEKHIAKQEEFETNSILIHPDPCYVIKTFNIKSQQKIFINVCSHRLVGAPFAEKITEDKNDEENRTHFSLSSSEPFKDFDNSGKECTVFDVVVNPDVIKAIFESLEYREFVSHVIIQNIQHKHELQLDSEDIRYPKITYKGSSGAPIPQRIRKDKANIIESIDKDNEKTLKSTPSKIPPTKLDFILFLKNDSDQIEYNSWVLNPSFHPHSVILETTLPLVKSIDEIIINISPTDIEINDINDYYHLHIDWPCPILLTHEPAYFNKSSSLLYLSYPLYINSKIDNVKKTIANTLFYSLCK